MPEYKTEIREIYDKKYLKVLLKDKSRFKEVQIVLNNLPSVKNVNITKNTEIDLTIYPNKMYSADEMRAEAEEALKVIFNSRPADPIIQDDILDSLGNDTYRKIIEMIYLYGKNLEKYTALKSKFDEEGYREFFLPHLNSMSRSRSATGETFNKIGKTDILIQNQKGENEFIAECKVWTGESAIHAALDQLFGRYVAWRDEKVALIIFNKTVQGFSSIIDKAVNSLKKHPLFKKFNGMTKDSCASFTFVHPDDPKKEVMLELMLFDCFN